MTHYNNQKLMNKKEIEKVEEKRPMTSFQYLKTKTL